MSHSISSLQNRTSLPLNRVETPEVGVDVAAKPAVGGVIRPALDSFQAPTAKGPVALPNQLQQASEVDDGGFDWKEIALDLLEGFGDLIGLDLSFLRSLFGGGAPTTDEEVDAIGELSDGSGLSEDELFDLFGGDALGEEDPAVDGDLDLASLFGVDDLSDADIEELLGGTLDGETDLSDDDLGLLLEQMMGGEVDADEGDFGDLDLDALLGGDVDVDSLSDDELDGLLTDSLDQGGDVSDEDLGALLELLGGGELPAEDSVDGELDLDALLGGDLDVSDLSDEEVEGLLTETLDSGEVSDEDLGALLELLGGEELPAEDAVDGELDLDALLGGEVDVDSLSEDDLSGLLGESLEGGEELSDDDLGALLQVMLEGGIDGLAAAEGGSAQAQTQALQAFRAADLQRLIAG